MTLALRLLLNLFLLTFILWLCSTSSEKWWKRLCAMLIGETFAILTYALWSIP